MKYKLWDVINECWYERGDIYLDEDGHLFCIEEITRGYEVYMNKENVNARYELVRFTGLQDRDGRDVYEGDIIRVTSHGDIYTDIVKWSKTKCSYIFSDDSNVEYYCADEYKKENSEVIGNIYANPELLEATV